MEPVALDLPNQDWKSSTFAMGAPLALPPAIITELLLGSRTATCPLRADCIGTVAQDSRLGAYSSPFASSIVAGFPLASVPCASPPATNTSPSITVVAV